MTELPSLLKRDAPYRQSGTGFDKSRLRRVSGDVRLPTAGRAGLLRMWVHADPAGLARERAGLLVRYVTLFCGAKATVENPSAWTRSASNLWCNLPRRLSLLELRQPKRRQSVKILGLRRLEAKSSVCRNGHVVHITRDSKDAKSRPAAVGRSAPLTRLVQVAASAYRHCLAIDERGRVIGWGDATKGALGPSKAKSIGVPTPLSLPIRSSVVDGGCGSAFSAAVTADELWAGAMSI